MLDYLFEFADDERILLMYKKVCRQEDTQCNTNMYQPGQLAAIAAEPTGKIVKDRRMPTFRHREYPGDCLCDGLKYRS